MTSFLKGYALCSSDTDVVNEIDVEGGSLGEQDKHNSFFKYGGAGFLIAIAYLDPGNLEADLQAGSYAKYQLIWVLFYSQFVGFILQNMASRIGIVTGKHLAQLCKEEYGPRTVKSLWICAELSIIACDVQAVITSAIALRILFGWPLTVGCVVTGVDAITFLMLDKLGVHSLEWFFVVLVAMMGACFFWNFSVNPPHATEVIFGTFVPTMTSYSLKSAVAIVGSLILPQNYFLHSALVLKRPIDRSSPALIREADKYIRADTLLALVVAFLINFTVVSCFAELFFDSDCLQGEANAAACVPSSTSDREGAQIMCDYDGEEGVCSRIGLSDAGLALSGALGGTASTVWALGLLASGQSSTMTITYAGQFIMDGFGDFKVPLYWRVIFCRLTALVPAVLAALSHTSDSSTMDDVTQWGNILASICVPFAILPMLRFCHSERLMGEHVMDRYSLTLIWSITVFLIFTNVYLIWTHILEATNIPFAMALPALLALTAAYLYGVYSLVDDEVWTFFRNIRDARTGLGAECDIDLAEAPGAEQDVEKEREKEMSIDKLLQQTCPSPNQGEREVALTSTGLTTTSSYASEDEDK